MTKAVIEAYFDAFNTGEVEAMLALLDTDIEHRVNEGGIRRGKLAFAEFCAHMNHAYQEALTDIVTFSTGDGPRGAAEFVVNGQYLRTDPGPRSRPRRLRRARGPCGGSGGRIRPSAGWCAPTTIR